MISTWWQKGDTQIDEDLWSLLEKLADDKPVNEGNGREEREVTILRRSETVGNADSLRGSVLMAKKSCGHWLTKSLITYLSELRLAKRKWCLRKKPNTWE